MPEWFEKLPIGPQPRHTEVQHPMGRAQAQVFFSCPGDINVQPGFRISALEKTNERQQHEAFQEQLDRMVPRIVLHILIKYP